LQENVFQENTMTNRRYLPAPTFALAAAALSIALLIGCTETKQNPPAPPPAPSEKVFVVFEGPWGFAPDPKDAKFVIAMAPKTKEHRDLYVKASYHQELEAGNYELSMPAPTVAPSGKIIPDIVRAKIAPKDVQRVLDDKLERYTVRLPKPESYAPATRYLSSVGTTPPPGSRDVPPKPWATAVSLQYSLASLSTFELRGNSDTSSFKPFPLQVDTPQISFVIHPKHDDDPDDKCFTHERETFHILTKLLGLTLYVDYPESPAGCLDKDPQKPQAARAQVALPSRMERLLAFAETNVPDVQEAGVAPASWSNSLARSPMRRLTAAFYFFFARPSGDCKPPTIVDNGGD
jgi:hypothetical protein